MDSSGIGVSNLPNQRYRSFCKKGINYNIMVAGGNGLGKTSFINSLLGTDLLNMRPFDELYDLNVPGVTVRSGEAPYDVVKDLSDCNNMPDFWHLKTKVTFQIIDAIISEKKFKVNLSITEVDGVGDAVNNDKCWEPILKYIDEQYFDYKKQEKEKVKSLIEDKRIHACIYFIDPNGPSLKPVDIKVMKELSQRVNLIPVVPKADMFTEHEMAIFYENIQKRIELENIHVFECLTHSERETGEYLPPPYFIITPGKRMNGCVSMNERVYPWGTVDMDDTTCNDFNKLKNILIKSNLSDLIETTDGYYDKYRTEELFYKFLDENLLSSDEKKLSEEFMERIKKDDLIINEMRMRLNERKKEYEAMIMEEEKKHEPDLRLKGN